MNQFPSPVGKIKNLYFYHFRLCLSDSKFATWIFIYYLQKAMDERFATQAQIENDTRAYKLQCAKFDEEVNTAKAQGIF